MEKKDKREEALKVPPPIDKVRQRQYGGKTLSYLNASYVIQELNEIFGYQGWSSEVSDLHITALANNKYTARVKVRMRIHPEHGFGCHEEYGFGYGNGAVVGEEMAVKAATSDGLKRCARLVGERLGNDLYHPTDEPVDMTEYKDASSHQILATNTEEKHVVYPTFSPDGTDLSKVRSYGKKDIERYNK